MWFTKNTKDTDSCQWFASSLHRLVRSHLTFLQNSGLADLLSSNCKLRLLLAGRHDWLQVIVAFLLLQKAISIKHLKLSNFKLCKLERWSTVVYLDRIPALLLSLCVCLSPPIFIWVLIWCLVPVVTIFIICLEAHQVLLWKMSLASITAHT